jgi:hypothetical protein
MQSDSELTYGQKYYRKNREKRLNESKEYGQKHSEERKAYHDEYYQKHKEGWNRRSPEQRDKNNANRRAKYAADPEYRAKCIEQAKQRSPMAKRESRLKQEYGLTNEGYDAILKSQFGLCAICGKEQADKRGHRLHVDHCHKTGQVRGLLCSNCNQGIGKFQDKIEFLESAVQYLRRYKQDETTSL